MQDPNKDGIDHINIYSKGKTQLGRVLSNFAHTPLVTEDGYFESIEGYWYWLSCKDDRLRSLWGFEAKKVGREIGAHNWSETPDFQRKIKSAISIKIYSDSVMLSALNQCDLPLKHYYVYGDKVVEPKEGKWILDHIENIRRDL